MRGGNPVQQEGTDAAPKKFDPFGAFVGIITGVFTPALGVLCACGILKGLLSLFVALGVLDGAGSTYNILYSLGDAFFYFMPILLALFFSWLAGISGIVYGFVIGGLWQILVMFGLHWALVPMMLNNLQSVGQDTILSAMLGTTFAQTGAVLAIWVKTKNAKTRALCPPAFISAIAGVTEPAIYGLTLPKKKPFVVTCVVAAITGAAMVATNTIAYSMGGLGVFAYTQFINLNTNEVGGMVVAIVISLVAVVLGFLGTFFTYSEDTAKK